MTGNLLLPLPPGSEDASMSYLPSAAHATWRVLQDLPSNMEAPLSIKPLMCLLLTLGSFSGLEARAAPVCRPVWCSPGLSLPFTEFSQVLSKGQGMKGCWAWPHLYTHLSLCPGTCLNVLHDEYRAPSGSCLHVCLTGAYL